MQLTRIAGTCPDGVTCPTVYATDRGTIVVQGYTLNEPGLALPEGEQAVEIPTALLDLLLDAHRR